MLDPMTMMGGPAAPPAPPAPEPPMGAAPDEDMFEMLRNLVRSIEEADQNVNPKERLIFEKINTLIAQLQAERYKEEQAALGGGPATNFLRRTSGA